MSNRHPMQKTMRLLDWSSLQAYLIWAYVGLPGPWICARAAPGGRSGALWAPARASPGWRIRYLQLRVCGRARAIRPGHPRVIRDLSRLFLSTTRALMGAIHLRIRAACCARAEIAARRASAARLWPYLIRAFCRSAAAQVLPGGVGLPGPRAYQRLQPIWRK